MPACCVVDFFLPQGVRDEPGIAWVIQDGMMTAGYDYLLSANNRVCDQ